MVADKMKKQNIIIFIIITVISGILAGYFISRLAWKEEELSEIPGFSGLFTGGSNPVDQDTDEPVKEYSKHGSGLKADYRLTDDQRYYIPLSGEGDRNVLLIGEDASSGNWDTIIVASVSESDKKIRLINFPRDIYVNYSEAVLDQLREKSPKLYEAKGFQKINAAHTVGSRIGYEEGKGDFEDSNFDFLADLLEEVFQLPIDDYAYVNTKGFRDVVNLFGGVDLEVPVRMKYDDPVQDLHIDLQPGMQHLNGEQAEGFVRFRQGYNNDGKFVNYSDQFRKENQNKFLEAFFKQHVNLKNLGKVDDLTKLMSKNIRTSINSVKSIGVYVNLLSKALSENYTRESIIVECPDTKKIDGVFFDIIRSE